MNYEDLEDEIIAKINPSLTSGNIDFGPLPENEEDLKKALTRPRVWVSFNMSDYNPPKSMSAEGLAQDVVVTIEVIIQSKKRRGAQGCYIVMNLIKLLLLGFRPSGLTAMTLQKEELLNFDQQGFWNYRQLYTSKGTQIQEDDGTVDVILQQIAVNTTEITNGV
jgi:hypothetical protein